MREGKVLYSNEEAGSIVQKDDGSFVFRYDDQWFSAIDKPPVSLTLPKSKQVHKSGFLFPFFYNMLPEGSNKQALCFLHRIDEDDSFGLLLAVAGQDTIGAVRVVKSESSQ